MLENIGKYYILNGEIESSKQYKKKKYNNRIYEIVRIVDGSALFLEDHYERLEGSATLIGKTLPLKYDGLAKHINDLVDANDILNNNVMVISYYNNKKFWYIIYFRKSFYPCVDMYKEGVETEVLKLKRTIPNAKILNLGYQAIVTSEIRKRKVFEVLLINEDQEVTEGSKTNIFFYREGIFYTAPSDMVLMGITRKYIINIIKELGYDIKEKSILLKDLSIYEGAFLSGTSIGVLPIKQIGDITYNVSQVFPIKEVHKKYNKLIKARIKKC